MKNSRLALVILAVDDLARARRFYESAFGWLPHVEVPVYAEYVLPAGMRLGLYEAGAFSVNTGRSSEPNAPGRTTRSELYFFPDDLDAAIAAVLDAGGELLSPLASRSWGDETAYFADPDGNVIALARELDG